MPEDRGMKISRPKTQRMDCLCEPRGEDWDESVMIMGEDLEKVSVQLQVSGAMMAEDLNMGMEN